MYDCWGADTYCHERRHIFTMKVAVLVATYNGERYLAEQLDSILNQNDVEVSVVVRDDGSKDGTINILNKYKEMYPMFTYYTGSNVRSARCFFDLLSNAGEADYYAFADQDDVWDVDKLAIATNMLNGYNQSKPQLYISNLRVVDQDLNFIRNTHSIPRDEFNSYSVLTEYYATGCTMVFNRALLKMCATHLPQGEIMHDTWFEFVARFFGEVHYDFEPHISYRQHGNNVIGTNISNRALWMSRIKRILEKQEPRYHHVKVFLDTFDSVPSKEDWGKLNKVVHYKDSIGKWLSLLFDKEIRTSSWKAEMRYRFLILCRMI